HRLVTVRYDEPRPFAIVSAKLARTCPAPVTGESVMMDLLDAVIDRAADILERIGVDVDQVSHDIFEPEGSEADRSRSYNDILKIFSVVAVVLRPPTLVASIYGMNFKVMPELEWPLGYPFALVLMLVAAVLPYLFFKWRKWL